MCGYTQGKNRFLAHIVEGHFHKGATVSSTTMFLVKLNMQSLQRRAMCELFAVIIDKHVKNNVSYTAFSCWTLLAVPPLQVGLSKIPKYKTQKIHKLIFHSSFTAFSCETPLARPSVTSLFF